jgi:hypothetical protein
MLESSAWRRAAWSVSWLLLLLAACREPAPPPRSPAADPTLSAKAARLALDNEAQVKERDRAFLLDASQQRAKFRAFASERKSELLTVEGLRQLVWLGDEGGVDLAIGQLSHPESEVVEIAALALAEYAPPASNTGKEALLAAFARTEPRSRPALAWALAVLGERRALGAILELYQRGQLNAVRRVDGGPAFSPEPLAALLDEQQALGFVRSPVPGLRRLAALKLAADPRHAELSAGLLGDGDLEVVRWAASGVARAAEPRRREMLKKALAGALSSRRGIYLDGLMRGGGVEAALALLAAGDAEPEEQRWLLADLVLQGIRLRADPRGGDALDRFIASRPHPHWETQAALGLAEIGDLRAVPALARRLAIDPLKGYDAGQPSQARFTRDDSQRILAAQALGDLIELHPTKLAEIRAASEQALLGWAKARAVPHASALQALAALESNAGIELVRRWADPGAPLPAPGAAPPLPEAFAVAESALRSLGHARRFQSAPLFEKQLRRRPKNLDVSSAGLLAGRHAMLGMAVRALSIGAADGAAAAGDARAAGVLLSLIDEAREHEDARLAACRALVWVAPAERAQELSARIRDGADGSTAARWRRQCLLTGLSERVPAGMEAVLVESITPRAAPELQLGAGRALGKRGLGAEERRVLLERVEDSRTMIGSGLALVLGSDPDAVTRTIAIVAARSGALREELAREWKNSLVELSNRDAEAGAVLRWVKNARAAARVAVGTARQTELEEILAERLAAGFAGAGPHALSRTVLRVRLWQLATGTDGARQVEALDALSMMKERGALAALSARNDALGKQARRALFEVDHPRRGPAF